MALHIEQVAPGFDKTFITNFFFFFFYEIIVVVLSSVSSKINMFKVQFRHPVAWRAERGRIILLEVDWGLWREREVGE